MQKMLLCRIGLGHARRVFRCQSIVDFTPNPLLPATSSKYSENRGTWFLLRHCWKPGRCLFFPQKVSQSGADFSPVDRKNQILSPKTNRTQTCQTSRLVNFDPYYHDFVDSSSVHHFSKATSASLSASKPNKCCWYRLSIHPHFA